MTRPVTCPVVITVSYAIGSMAMSQNEAGIVHYIDTTLNSEGPGLTYVQPCGPLGKSDSPVC